MSIKFDGKKKVTQNLKFKPDPKHGNLCIGYLNKVSVDTVESPLVDDKGNPNKWEFAGIKVPRLVLEYRNIPEKNTDPERFYFHTEGPITQTRNDGTSVEEKKIQSMYTALFDRIIHMYNVYEGASNYQELEIEVEIDEKNNAENRAKQMTKFFKDVAYAFNKGKDEKPVFMEGNKHIPLYMKLLPDYQRGVRLEFPTFVGEGFVEVTKEGIPPVIEIKPNESVELVSKKTTASAVASDSKAQDELPPDVKELIEKMQS